MIQEDLKRFDLIVLDRFCERRASVGAQLVGVCAVDEHFRELFRAT